MARRFEHEGAIWEVELAGPGTIGCSIRRVEVTFRNLAEGVAIPGRLSMTGDGRLSDAHLAAALAEAQEASDSEP